MATHLAEVEQIAADPGPAIFANTAEALELCGRDLARVSGVFFNLVGPDTTECNEIAQHLSTALTDHFNTIAMNPELFASYFVAAWSGPMNSGCPEPQRRLLDKAVPQPGAVRGLDLAPDGQAQIRRLPRGWHT